MLFALCFLPRGVPVRMQVHGCLRMGQPVKEPRNPRALNLALPKHCGGSHLDLLGVSTGTHRQAPAAADLRQLEEAWPLNVCRPRAMNQVQPIDNIKCQSDGFRLAEVEWFTGGGSSLVFHCAPKTVKLRIFMSDAFRAKYGNTAHLISRAINSSGSMWKPLMKPYK